MPQTRTQSIFKILKQHLRQRDNHQLEPSRTVPQGISEDRDIEIKCILWRGTDTQHKTRQEVKLEEITSYAKLINQDKRKRYIVSTSKILQVCVCVSTISIDFRWQLVAPVERRKTCLPHATLAEEFACCINSFDMIYTSHSYLNWEFHSTAPSSCHKLVRNAFGIR